MGIVDACVLTNTSEDFQGERQISHYTYSTAQLMPSMALLFDVGLHDH